MGARRPTDRRRPARVGHADAARRTAYDVLRAVDERDAYANLVLPGLLRERGLTGRDAAFTTELAYGTLRSLGTYDAVLAACSTRDLDTIDRPVLDVLRLGVHQLLSMRVPSHAAVSATVDLARASVGRAAVGFVNAVLRKAGSRDRAGWVAALAPAFDEDPVGHLALAESHPRWIVAAYLDALDGDLGETAAACRAGNVAPLVHLVARPGRITRDELLAEVPGAGRAGPWSPYAVHLDEGDPAGLAPVRDGRAAVQDEGSQLAALALARGRTDGRSERWLDVCSGPGGKAALLAGLLPDDASRLVCADRAPHRARLVVAGVAGHGSVVVADGTRPAWADARFDRVLVDVPCSGLGALRRRPEARWRRQADDVERLHPVQVSLLTAAVRATRPGGLVAYVTCSPHRRETSDVVAEVVGNDPSLVPEPTVALLPEVPGLSPGSPAQLWPHRHGTDAMFISILRRVVRSG